ncbi:MAG: hypothetical protein V3W06_09150 [Acidimicrobiia bacterium]
MNRRALLTALAGLPFCKGLMPKAEATEWSDLELTFPDGYPEREEKYWRMPLSPYEGLYLEGWVGPQLQFQLDGMYSEGMLLDGSRALNCVTGQHDPVERRTDGLWVFKADV